MVLAVIDRCRVQHLIDFWPLEWQVGKLFASVESCDEPRRGATEPSGAIVD